MSALKRYFKRCHDLDNKKMPVEDEANKDSSPVKARDRRLSLGTSLEWD